MNSFIVDGVFYWTAPDDFFRLRQGLLLTAVEWKELLPVSSLGHLDHGSMNYDLGLYGTSMSGLLFHGGAVLTGMGSF